jgi:glycosyltransferase involved in cell wall biosynthesis
MPQISVLVPVRDGMDRIGAAIDSALAAGVADVEIVIAPDDGRDYAAILSDDPRIVVLPPGPVGSGPGPARNRALLAAVGRYVALLDDDDRLSPGYLAALLPVAEARGLAYAVTEMVEADGTVARRLPADGPFVDFATARTAYGSLRSLAARPLVGPFADTFAEDVLWEIETLSVAGGRAPLVAAARYRAMMRPGSLTAGGVAGDAIDAAYAAILRRIAAGETRIRPAHREGAAAIFTEWRRMNAAFEVHRRTGGGLGYHAFVATKP